MLGIPLAATGREEIAVVNVDRARTFSKRIDHGVDDVPSEHGDVASAEVFCAGGFDAAGFVLLSAPEDVVLPTAIHADHRARVVIVRQRPMMQIGRAHV